MLLNHFGSFIQQKHSYSRLLITRELFEALMSEFVIFPRFREFVLLFGAKQSENEVGHPQLRCRRLTEGNTIAGHQGYGGFGMYLALHYICVTKGSRNCIRAQIC